MQDCKSLPHLLPSASTGTSWDMGGIPFVPGVSEALAMWQESGKVHEKDNVKSSQFSIQASAVYMTSDGDDCFSLSSIRRIILWSQSMWRMLRSLCQSQGNSCVLSWKG